MLDMHALQDEVDAESSFIDQLFSQVALRVVGQRSMIEGLVVGLLTGGHVLLEGVPGLAKTTAVRALAEALRLQFSRVQFTPDLLPADIIGTQIYNPRDQVFEARLGPIFANIVLADEINRAPAKVQAALLEAMQERQATLGDTSHALPHPFLVLATQNPIEQEGTYALPEAQVDRFMLLVRVDYPTRDEERRLLDLVVASKQPTITPLLDGPGILRAQRTVEKIHAQDSIKDYIIDIVQATRDPRRAQREDLGRYVELGASPRASIALLQASKAKAFLEHRAYVLPEDVKAMAQPVLHHRITPSFEAEADGIARSALIQELVDAIDVP